VATFNQRAIKLYRKVGFKDAETIMQDTNGILMLITLGAIVKSEQSLFRHCSFYI